MVHQHNIPLPSKEVGRILCLVKVPEHVSHKNMDSMGLKSQVFFVDVLMKNEADRLGESTFDMQEMISLPVNCRQMLSGTGWRFNQRPSIAV